MDVHISLSKVRAGLFVTWAFLVMAGFAAEAWKYLLNRRDWMDVVYFCGLSYEQNLPTWYSSSLLLLCAIVLSLIGMTQRLEAGHKWHWWGLAAGFAYISLDETAMLHEDLSSHFDLGGPFYFGWVIPASIVVIVLGALYLRFLAHLPSRTRRQFIVAGAIYVGGALGVEFLLGYWTDLAGTKNLVYGLIDLVEESMEILGVSLFLCALLEFAGGERQQLAIDLR